MQRPAFIFQAPICLLASLCILVVSPPSQPKLHQLSLRQKFAQIDYFGIITLVSSHWNCIHATADLYCSSEHCIGLPLDGSDGRDFHDTANHNWVYIAGDFRHRRIQVCGSTHDPDACPSSLFYWPRMPRDNVHDGCSLDGPLLCTYLEYSCSWLPSRKRRSKSNTYFLWLRYWRPYCWSCVRTTWRSILLVS